MPASWDVQLVSFSWLEMTQCYQDTTGSPIREKSWNGSQHAAPQSLDKGLTASICQHLSYSVLVNHSIEETKHSLQQPRHWKRARGDSACFVCKTNSSGCISELCVTGCRLWIRKCAFHRVLRSGEATGCSDLERPQEMPSPQYVPRGLMKTLCVASVVGSVLC